MGGGARVTAGGGRDGPFLAPTVLEGVAPGMRVRDAEILGPVAPIGTFRTEAEAIADDTA